MQTIREVLRLKYRNGLTTRQIQTITKVSKSSVANYIKIYIELEANLDEVLALDDKTLASLFFNKNRETTTSLTTKASPTS